MTCATCHAPATAELFTSGRPICQPCADELMARMLCATPGELYEWRLAVQEPGN